jgi:hypothetical protein
MFSSCLFIKDFDQLLQAVNWQTATIFITKPVVKYF